MKFPTNTLERESLARRVTENIANDVRLSEIKGDCIPWDVVAEKHIRKLLHDLRPDG